jgi:hypothetical protein
VFRRYEVAETGLSSSDRPAVPRPACRDVICRARTGLPRDVTCRPDRPAHGLEAHELNRLRALDRYLDSIEVGVWFGVSDFAGQWGPERGDELQACQPVSARSCFRRVCRQQQRCDCGAHCRRPGRRVTAALELRRLFPGIANSDQARAFARTNRRLEDTSVTSRRKMTGNRSWLK